MILLSSPLYHRFPNPHFFYKFHYPFDNADLAAFSSVPNIAILWNIIYEIFSLEISRKIVLSNLFYWTGFSGIPVFFFPEIQRKRSCKNFRLGNEASCQALFCSFTFCSSLTEACCYLLISIYPVEISSTSEFVAYYPAPQTRTKTKWKLPSHRSKDYKDLIQLGCKIQA